MTRGAQSLEVIHHIMHYKSFLIGKSVSFLLSLDLTADLPTCCTKGHMARGYDLTVLPCWSVRPQCATPTLSDRPCEHMHENWYLHKGPHHSSAAVMDWDSARVHSGLGPGTAVKCFILWALNGSVAKLQELCFAHKWHFWILDCLERWAGSSEVPVSSPPYFINLQVLCNLWSSACRP